MSFDFPKARQENLVENLHGSLVPDPYRWMEDLENPELREWIEAQNALTFDFLESSSRRDEIQERMTDLWNYEKFSPPVKRGGRYFMFYNDGLQNQNVLYWVENLGDTPQVLIDPNVLSEDGTVSLSGAAVSRDGRYLAYGLSDAGSDWQTWYVRRVDDGQDLPDRLEWIKFSEASWDKNGEGFFYSRYEAPEGDALKQANYYHKLYYHRLGTDQTEDRLIYQRTDQKEWGFNGEVTEDGRYLVIYAWHGTAEETAVFYLDLHNPDAGVQDLLPDFDAAYNLAGSLGGIFYFVTDHGASQNQLVAVELQHPQPEHWQVLISEDEDKLEAATLVGGKFVCIYLHHAAHRVYIMNTDGTKEGELDLPGLGMVSGFNGKADDPETFYQFSNFTTPGTIYHLNVETLQNEVFRAPKISFDQDAYVTRQVFYESKDGIRVPMFISHLKELKINGKTPTYLYGYGGFNIPVPVSFSVPNLVWMEMGGIYAQAHLRGGGEYGRDWHQAGMLKNKQNVFDDFIAAAEYLIDQGYTETRRLVIGGRSNGGLLVGACLTQRPDLFGVCLPNVGVMDMLRFHKFTIGWAWVSDYGSPDDPESFEILNAYSPYHNIRDGVDYPAVMVLTGDHDDRVFPAHSFKFAARLQDAQAGQAPVMIRIETRAGHGAGKPTTKLIEEFSDMWTFALANMH